MKGINWDKPVYETDILVWLLLERLTKGVE